MRTQMKVLGLIPARGGSKGIPHKNIADLGGRPLISYTIEAALDCPYIDRLIVSTDDKDIARVAERCGAEVPFLRPEYLSTDRSKSIDAVIHAVNFCKESGDPYDILVLLQPTSPFRDAVDISGALQEFATGHPDQDCRSLLSICPVADHPLLTRTYNPNTGRLTSLMKDQSTVRRQDMPAFYHVNGAIYINYCDDLRPGTSLNDNEYGYIMSRDHSLDIDSSEDLELARAMLKAGLK